MHMEAWGGGGACNAWCGCEIVDVGVCACVAMYPCILIFQLQGYTGLQFGGWGGGSIVS